MNTSISNPTSGGTPDVVQLDPSLTLALAEASVAAYNDYLGIKFTPPPNYSFYARFTGWDDWFVDVGVEERFGLIFKYTGPQMIANRFIVAFRGTSSPSDMFEDLFWGTTSFKPYRNAVSPVKGVCVGFSDIYSTLGGSMRQTMQQQIFSLLPDQPSEVLITGHSLGGALSQLFTLDMRISSPSVNIRTINFSSPRVGDKAWKDACDHAGATQKITRVINYWDVVPLFPPEDIGYQSIGTEFQTAFSRRHWYDGNLLSDHSILNLQTVLNHCVWLTPQVWKGTFVDAVDAYYTMLSTAPPSASKDPWLDKLNELHEVKKSILATAEGE